MNLRIAPLIILVLSVLALAVQVIFTNPASVRAANANTVDVITPVDDSCETPAVGDPDDPKVLCVQSALNSGNSLIAEIEVTVNTPSKVFVIYENAGAGRFRSKTTEVAATEHTVSLLGLRPSTTYTYQAFVETDPGAAAGGLGGSFTTGSLPVDLQPATFTLLQGQTTSPLILLEHSAGDFIGIVALDSKANVVWYYEALEEDGIGALVQQADGNILYQATGFLGVRATRIKEITPLGEVVASNPVICELPLDPGDPVPEGGVHHEILAPVNGKVLYMGRIIRDPFSDPARLQASDSIRQWDKSTGQDVRVWDPFDFLDPLTERTASSDKAGDSFWASCDGTVSNEDWTHSNSIQVGPSGNIIMSVRHLNQVIAIAPDFQSVVWRLGGPGSDFSFPDPSDQFYHQHSARELVNGNILLFDNGNDRPEAEGGEYSRGLELALDTTSMTASKVWEFRHSPDLYSQCCSSATRLGNGNTVLQFGCCTTGLRTVEVDNLGNIVAEIDISAPSKVTQYRAYPSEHLDGESKVATLGPALPDAIFTADVTSGPAPLTVQFSDQSTGAPTSWHWDFDTATDSDGDGISNNDVDSIEQHPVHIYSQPGTFAPKLTVTTYDLADNKRWKAGSSQTNALTPLIANKLKFSVQPGNPGDPLYLQPKVIIQDAIGSTVTTSAEPVTLSITPATNASGVNLLGTTTVSAANGVASFTDLHIDASGFDLTLTASSGTLTPVASSPFWFSLTFVPSLSGWGMIALAIILVLITVHQTRHYGIVRSE